MAVQGWVKLHRKLLDNPIMKEPELLQLFMYCLLRANHEPATAFIGKGEEQIVQRGQFITGRFEISKDLNQNPNTTYKRLLKLEKLNFLNIKSNNKNSLVTIVNYDLYQSDNEQSNTKSNNKVTTKEQQSNTNKNNKNDNNDNKKTLYGAKVKLTSDEHQKLIEQFGQAGTNEKINNLDLYIQSTGKKYASHYATILNWERKNSSNTNQASFNKQSNKKADKPYNIFAEIARQEGIRND